MMKRFLRRLPLFCLLASLLAGTALADFGPKPQLVVRVVNGPEEDYYLDLLAEGEFTDGGYDGLEWRSDRDTPLDEVLLAAVRDAVPDGWHACTAQGSAGAPMWGDLTGTNGVHTFGYIGVPETYRILVATRSGEVWMSETLEREALQASVTVDWAEKSVKTPSIWLAYALQILSTLIPTLLIEGLLLLAFRFDWKRNWRPFLLVNLVTQGALAAIFGISVVREGFSFLWMIVFVPAEIAVALAEAFLYRRFLQGRSKGRALAYGLTANAVSAVLGWFLTEAVWRFVVSIS